MNAALARRSRTRTCSLASVLFKTRITCIFCFVLSLVAVASQMNVVLLLAGDRGELLRVLHSQGSYCRSRGLTSVCVNVALRSTLWSPFLVKRAQASPHLDTERRKEVRSSVSRKDSAWVRKPRVPFKLPTSSPPSRVRLSQPFHEIRLTFDWLIFWLACPRQALDHLVEVGVGEECLCERGCELRFTSSW